jgi:hypothetical protein
MEQGFFIALGVAVIFGFLLYAVKAMPRSLAWIGIAAGVALMALDIANLRAYAWPTVAAFVGLFCLAGSGLWTHRIYTTTEAPVPKEPKVEPKSVSLVAEGGFLGYLPPNLPANWHTYVIRITKGGEIDTSGYIGMTPQQAGIFPQNKRAFAGHCKITNYGTIPVFSLWVELNLTLHEIIPDPKNQNAKISNPEPKLKGMIRVLINKIDAGPTNSVSFALVNLSPYAATAVLPSHVMASPLNAEKQSIPLSQPNLANIPMPLTIVLPPFDETAP